MFMAIIIYSVMPDALRHPVLKWFKFRTSDLLMVQISYIPFMKMAPLGVVLKQDGAPLPSSMVGYLVLS